MRSFLTRSLCCVLLSVLGVSSSRADNGWEGQIVSLLWENDAIAGSDKHYTQGAGLSYLSRDDALPGWLQRFSGWIPAVGYDVQAQKYGVGIMQETYTPEELRSSALVVNTQPCAGWLCG